MTKEDSDHADSPSVPASASYKFFDCNLHYQFYTESGAAPSVMPGDTSQIMPSATPQLLPSPAPQVVPENPATEKAQTSFVRQEDIHYQPSSTSVSNAEPDSHSQTSTSTFSHAFNFNESLLKIFWRIDIDRNNRVNKAELQNAIGQKWFNGDEQILAEVLLSFYDELVSAPVFCDAGLSVNQILSSPLFSEMATKESDFYQPYGGYKKTKTKTNSFKMMLFRR